MFFRKSLKSTMAVMKRDCFVVYGIVRNTSRTVGHKIAWTRYRQDLYLYILIIVGGEPLMLSTFGERGGRSSVACTLGVGGKVVSSVYIWWGWG